MGPTITALRAIQVTVDTGLAYVVANDIFAGLQQIPR